MPARSVFRADIHIALAGSVLIREWHGISPSHCEPMLGGGITFVESRGFVAWQELAASDRTTGTGGSNPSCSTIQSASFGTCRRIDANPRVCARFAIAHGPREPSVPSSDDEVIRVMRLLVPVQN